MPRKKRGASIFAKNLESLLKEHKLTVREAARIAGVSIGTITNWKSGVLPDDFLAVKALAKHLGTTMSYLLTGEDDARGGTPPNVSEVFDEGAILFDGFAKIIIQKMVPKKKGGNE